MKAIDSILLYTLSAMSPPACRGLYTRRIAYSEPECSNDEALVVIVPSNFTKAIEEGAEPALPEIPLHNIHATPILFGTPVVKTTINKQGNKRLVIHADIIASAFFLLTRYEEVIRREVRDTFGRFPGRESLPYRAGFINRPIVDEYAAMLRQWLREVGVDIPEPPRAVDKVYLTHDVDRPWAWQTFRSSIRAVASMMLHNPKKAANPILSYMGLCANTDPYD